MQVIVVEVTYTHGRMALVFERKLLALAEPHWEKQKWLNLLSEPQFAYFRHFLKVISRAGEAQRLKLARICLGRFGLKSARGAEKA